MLRFCLGLSLLAFAVSAAAGCAGRNRVADSGVPPCCPGLPAPMPILIDVRTPEEYAAGHIEGAVLVPYDAIAERIAAVAPDKTRTLEVYCRSGRRSGIAMETLKTLGYADVVDLGGFDNLRQTRSAVFPATLPPLSAAPDKIVEPSSKEHPR